MPVLLSVRKVHVLEDHVIILGPQVLTTKSSEIVEDSEILQTVCYV